MKELSKIYDPKQVEDRTYQFWLDGGYFHAEPNPDKKPYTIVIPPPNITGQLHMGHALDETLQAASSSSSKSWAPPATGTASASLWTTAAPRRSRRSLSTSTTRASSTRASASSTGARTA